MRSSSTLQDRLVKQNEISRQRLEQELEKLEKVEKSDLRMIETARHRFRARHKNLDISGQSSKSKSNAINVRMYETHNPGFCYHCTGAIKQVGRPIKEQTIKDSYEFVRSIVFTKDQVDPDKILCLHLFTAHSTKLNNNDVSSIEPVASLLEKAKNNQFSGAWNNILPCYVVDLEEESKDMKLHENPTKRCLEEQTVREFEEKYNQYMKNNTDLANAKHTRVTLHNLEKTSTISPHVYSLLGASHELRIKQALAEGVVKKKFARSSIMSSGFDENSLSFHLDDEDDLVSRVTTNMSNRNWVTRSARRSTIGSLKLDHGITMLKSKRRKYHDVAKELITIKSSFTKEMVSKTPSIKSPFPSRPSSNSILSYDPELFNRRFKKCIYLNAPVQSMDFTEKDYKIVPILVNYQLQALVQTVIEVLERVNPEKSRRIIETAKDVEKIRETLTRSEILNFVRCLLGQSLVSSPESFVVSVAGVANEIDFRLDGILEKEIIALTLEIPSIPPLDSLIAEIRNNIFHEALSASKAEKAENETAGSSLNSKHVDNGPKVPLKRGKQFPNRNKDKSYSKKKSAKVKEIPRNDEKHDSLKHRVKQSSIKDRIVNESQKDNVVQISEIKAGRGWRKNSSIKSVEQPRLSGSILSKRGSNFKTWKTAQDHRHSDADHVILRRMTNPQRILVGQMCASLKARKINNQGLINESVPLAALITPALSRDCIKFLTRGTVYSKTNTINEPEEVENNVTVPDKLTGPLLAKIRQDVAENETKRRLTHFLKNDSV